jgi:hypothetical protein
MLEINNYFVKEKKNIIFSIAALLFIFFMIVSLSIVFLFCFVFVLLCVCACLQFDSYSKEIIRCFRRIYHLIKFGES